MMRSRLGVIMKNDRWNSVHSEMPQPDTWCWTIQPDDVPFIALWDGERWMVDEGREWLYHDIVAWVPIANPPPFIEADYADTPA